MKVEISIRRFDPETDSEPRWDAYTVPAGDRTTVLEALAYVYENLDPTLAYGSGCRFGACGLCAVEVNGQPRMACSALLKDGAKIAPLAGMPVLRDLVIDRTAFFDALRKLRIFIEEQARDLEISEIRRCNTEVADAVELPHMLATARAIAASALARTESRGAHVRSDFPERDDAEPVRNMVVRMRNGECSLRAVVSGE